MSYSPIYLRFLNLTQVITGELATSNLDLTALRLLEAVAVAYEKGSPLTVTNAMELKTIASPATLHRKLDALREADLVEQKFEVKNRRTKFLIPTHAAGKYFEQMGKALISATKQHPSEQLHL
jgi:DNA-binding MarR family transcriptional regulator